MPITETLTVDVDIVPADRRERIPDPTVRSVLPSNILAALGNTHANLVLELRRLMGLIDTVGWPEDNGRERYEPLDDRELVTALDYARENAQLTWTLCGLVSVLSDVLGTFVRDADGTLITMGD